VLGASKLCLNKNEVHEARGASVTPRIQVQATPFKCHQSSQDLIRKRKRKRIDEKKNTKKIFKIKSLRVCLDLEKLREKKKNLESNFLSII